MSAFLIAMLIAVYTLQSLLTKKYSEYYPGEDSMSSPVFTVVSGIVVPIVSYAFTGFHFEASWITMILAIMNGVALFIYNTCIIRATKNGPYSIVMVFLIAGGIVLPTLCAAIGFRELIHLGKWVSILVLLAAVYLTSKKSEDTEFVNKQKFLLSCVGLGFFNGVYGTLLDVQQRLTSPLQKEEMVIITYLSAMLLSGGYLLAAQGKKFIHAMRQTKKSCSYLIICSIMVALGVNLMVFILPLVNVTILYTFDNAGVFLVSVLISRFFFKEKMSALNWAGCVIMCLALVGVSIL